ncbi:Long-chain-fatty-acid--CoA ligase [Geobacillus stearothermophilus]|uniref:Long-chain-fatty-acid--CoA ligase n=1 Tax=Geobacillus stearothermophilus TaxID=1422 RepID=A0A150MFP4_GEOSE|nr:Long-chain-fatty-acid--CoA ligase [Geobacillus stearothermophilus]
MEKPWLAHYPPSIPATLDYPKKTFSDYLWETAEQYGDKDAIDFFGKTMTFRQVYEQALTFAHFLRRLGVQKRRPGGGDVAKLPAGGDQLLRDAPSGRHRRADESALHRV